MKSDVLQLVSDLSGGLADATVADRLYREIVMDWGQHEWLVSASQVTVDGVTAQYDAPPATLRILAVIFGDTVLSHTTRRALEAVDPVWRQTTGYPRAWVTETEGDRRFRLYPYPDVASTPMMVVTGALFGADWPPDSIAVIYTENRRDVLDWLQLPLALAILAREFVRESDHQSLGFAKVCNDLSTLLLQGLMR